jgi:hypothetical protein
VSDVYHVLTARYDVARARPAVPASAVAAAAAAQPNAVAPAAPATAAAPMVSANANTAVPVTHNPGPAFHSLFSDNQGQPVSRFVRDLWTTNPRVAAALSGQAPPTLSTAPAPASPASAPLDLFSDRPSDVRSLFGDRQ